ncbi:MAG: hypothetical protein RLZZ461_270 [Planctomycetota bacterium]|jgi:non-specific serine/threonine protein kinase/serine/threonine-protein kinase
MTEATRVVEIVGRMLRLEPPGGWTPAGFEEEIRSQCGEDSALADHVRREFMTLSVETSGRIRSSVHSMRTESHSTVDWQCDNCDRFFSVEEGADRIPCPSCGDINRPRRRGTELAEDEVWEGFGIHRLLDRGGQGVVYKAIQIEQYGRPVALKVRRAGRESREHVARFRREAELVSLLNGPGIAEVYQSGASGRGEPWVAMELLESGSIVEFADRHVLSISERIALMIKVCRAMAEVHERSVVHCDLKPSNILIKGVGEGATPKVIDFGAAEVKDPAALGVEEWEPLPPARTPGYAAPEQERGAIDAISAATDVHALGMVLCELLVGEIPRAGWREKETSVRGSLPIRMFNRLSPEQQELVCRRRRIATISRARAALSGELGHIVDHATDPDPGQRYANANELLMELQRYERNHRIEAAPRSIPLEFARFVRRHRLDRWTIPLLILVLLMVLYLFGNKKILSRLDEIERSVSALKGTGAAD